MIGMQFQGAVRLMTMQIDRDAGNGHMGQRQRYQNITPPGEMPHQTVC